MRIITLVTQKGGSGKTTLAACLAVAASEAGERAIALDLDPQQSLWKWGEERKVETPAVDKLDPTHLTQLSAIVKALEGQGFTLAVLDTAGVASMGGLRAYWGRLGMDRSPCKSCHSIASSAPAFDRPH